MATGCKWGLLRAVLGMLRGSDHCLGSCSLTCHCHCPAQMALETPEQLRASMMKQGPHRPVHKDFGSPIDAEEVFAAGRPPRARRKLGVSHPRALSTHHKKSGLRAQEAARAVGQGSGSVGHAREPSRPFPRPHPDPFPDPPRFAHPHPHPKLTLI